MKPQDVVDAADSQTLTEGKFRLWVVTQLNSFVHCSNDVCLGQELVRDVLLEVRQRFRV